ncbi:MAG: cytochrome c [Bacteroidota bacterium]
MMNKIKNILFVFALATVLYACSNAGENRTGVEYMPDMAHSIAVESNVYNAYWANTWDDKSVVSLKEMATPRKPVKGTIPRGRTEADAHIPNVNSTMPYYYDDTEEDRARATAEMLENPIPITAAGLAEGKELYNVFCAVCHGTGGQFKDGIYASGIYPAAPANLVNDEFTAATPGRYYHAIMHGKNVMGHYKDKINYEERWNVIHYIRSLQAKEKGATYNAEVNTLNAYGTPDAKWVAMKEMVEKVETVQEGAYNDQGIKQEVDGEHAHDGE